MTWSIFTGKRSCLDFVECYGNMSESTEKVGKPLSVSSELVADEAAVPAESSTGHDASEGPSAWSLLRELLETVILSLVIFLVIRQGVQNYRIESHSMQPNFYEGEFVLVNKLAYKLGDPARGDVIVFRNPANEDEDYIKRVIGLPGDTLQFNGDSLYVNGEPLDDSFTTQPTYAPIAEPVVVSPEHLFVMGDNRPNSRDSRAFGLLDDDLVVGKAWVRVWPIDEMGLIDHYSLEPGVSLAVEE